MTQITAPQGVPAILEEKEWVSPNEGIAHAPDPNDPEREVEGAFLFGGVLFDGVDWLDGSRTRAPERKES